MAARARGIEIPLRIRPDSAIKRSLRGVTKDARAATLTELAEHKRAMKEKQRTADKAEREQSAAAMRGLRMRVAMMAREAAAAERSARSRTQAEERALREQTAARRRYTMFVERQSRAEQASAARTARAQIREAQKLHRERTRLLRQHERDSREIMAGITGAVVGAGAYAIGRAHSVAGALGAQSPEQLMIQRMEVTREAIRVANQSGMSDADRKSMETSAINVGAKYGIDARDIMGGLAVQQSQFSEFGGAQALLPRVDLLAQASLALNTPFENLVRTMGVARRQLNLTAEQQDQALGQIVDSANRGNIEVKDLSEAFVSAIGALGRGANLGGLEGLGVALGISQALGASDMAPAEAATRGVNLVTALNKPEVREGLRERFKVNVANKDGTLRDLPTIFAELSAAGFTSAAKGELRAKAIGDLQGREAFEIITKQYEAAPELFAQLVKPDAQAGLDYVRKTSGELLAGSSGQALTLAARQLQGFDQSEQSQGFTDTMVKMGDALAELQGKYPAYSEAIGLATIALGGFTAALVLGGKRLGSLGGGSPLPGGDVLGGGATATAAKGAGRLTRLARGGGKLALLAAEGLAVYEGTRELVSRVPGADEMTGAFGRTVYDITHGDPTGAERNGGVMPARRWTGLAERVLPKASEPGEREDIASAVERAIARGMSSGRATLAIEITDKGARVQGVKRTDDFPVLPRVNTGRLP